MVVYWVIFFIVFLDELGHFTQFKKGMQCILTFAIFYTTCILYSMVSGLYEQCWQLYKIVLVVVMKGPASSVGGSLCLFFMFMDYRCLHI